MIGVTVMIFSLGTNASVASDLPALGVFLAAELIGFTMIESAQILDKADHYRIPGHRILPFFGLKLAVQALAVMFAALAVATTVSLAYKTGNQARWIIATGLSGILMIVAYRRELSRGEIWRRELSDLTMGPEPPVRANH